MSSEFLGITWSQPWCIVWLIPLAVLIVGWFVRSQSLVARLAAPEHQKMLIKNFSSARYRAKTGLLLLGTLFLVLAALWPQWDKVEETVAQEGRDIIIALDISRSMLAQDVQPNRLEYAKNKIKKLIQELGPERVGLLVFSGEAVMQCPLTTDFAAFFMFLDTLSVESIASGTTSLGKALDKVLTAFASFTSNRMKLVALFTDGEDFSSDLYTIQQRSIDAGVHIFTLGIGSPEGAPIPLYDQQGRLQGYQMDGDNSIVISRLNSELMQKLAQESGGKYVQTRPDDADIKALKVWIEKFEKSRLEDRTLVQLQDKYYWFTGISFLLFLSEWLL